MPAVFQYLRLSVPHPAPNHVPNALLWPSSAMKEYTHHQPNMFQANYLEFSVKKISPSCCYLNSLRYQATGSLHISVDVGKISRFCNSHKLKVSIDLSEIQSSDEEPPEDVCSDSLQSLCDKDHKEKERRRKIGLANKGRVPWNKGRKHTAATRVRIKQRTIEALRDPKVRKKMGKHPLAHSAEIKARIGSSLRHVWGKRLRWKRLGEKFISSWSESIAKAAKDGYSDQRELDWDSYEKIKQELAVQQLQWAADKAKEKEMAKINAEKAALARAEKAALAKVEKIARLAEKKKEQEERAKARRELQRKRRKSMKIGELSVSQGLKLKKRLTKIHKKKSLSGPVTIRANMVDAHIPAWEKLDINLVKKEKMQREISLADQILAAKNKRAESMAKQVLASSSSVHQFSVRSTD